MLTPSVAEREVRLIAEGDYYRLEWQKAEARVRQLEQALERIRDWRGFRHTGEVRDLAEKVLDG